MKTLAINLLEDPKFKSFIDQFNAHIQSTSHLPLAKQRELRAKIAIDDQAKSSEKIYRIENIEILGQDHNKIPVRIFIPKPGSHLPIMMYFHGGGWVFGGIEDTDVICRRFANLFGVIVVSVDYRLAPESPFPKPLEDCYAATTWIAKNADEFGGDANHLLVSGESAGGNLAAAVARMARDKNGPKISAQLLMYPAISSNIIDSVYDNCPDHYFMTKEIMKYFWSMYVQKPGEDKNSYASLDSAEEFKNLPPALVITAEYDPMTHDTDQYALRLEQDGNRVIKISFPKLVHGFLYIPLYDESQKLEWTKEIRSGLIQLGAIPED